MAEFHVILPRVLVWSVRCMILRRDIEFGLSLPFLRLFIPGDHAVYGGTGFFNHVFLLYCFTEINQSKVYR